MTTTLQKRQLKQQKRLRKQLKRQQRKPPKKLKKRLKSKANAILKDVKQQRNRDIESRFCLCSEFTCCIYTSKRLKKYRRPSKASRPDVWPIRDISLTASTEGAFINSLSGRLV